MPTVCMPGQYLTEADCRLPVVLVSTSGAFGSEGSIRLIAEDVPDNPSSMPVVGSLWKSHAIVARFPETNPGTTNTLWYTIEVDPQTGDDVEVAPVLISGPPGSGWPPTHEPAEREKILEPVG